MGFSQNSCPDRNFKQRSYFGTECRRQMLKDFLSDESNSCSSGGFKSFPRKPSDSSIRTLVEIDLNVANSGNAGKLFRSRSRAAASTTISAFQAVIKAVKNISFTAAKPPSISPRSLSRRLSETTRRKHCCENKRDGETKITVVKVKDIIRWRSFRDLVEETSLPFDLASSPNHCNADTVTVTVTSATTGSPTTSTTTACSSSNGSSWCDSDFTSEFLPCWNGNSAEAEVEVVALAVVGKELSPCVGEDSMEPTKTKTTHTEVGPIEVKEKQQQHGPVSAIEYGQSEEWAEEPSLSSFGRSLENVERTKENLMERIRKFENLVELDPFNTNEWISSVSENTCSEEEHVDDEREEEEEEEEEACNEVEEKARQLLNHINATCSLEMTSCRNNVDQLLLDFVIDELMIFARACQNGIKEDNEKMLINKVKGWIDGDKSLLIEWELEHKREAYVKDMDRDGNWRNCRAEKEELTLAIEDEMLDLLVDELFS